MIRIEVPATSANLGPGFDALGLALALHNRFELGEAEGLRVEGAARGREGADNLLVRAYRRGLEELGLPFVGLQVRFETGIPVARGLGSSATCIVAGLLGAGRAAGKPGLPEERILELAAALEGHPDNTTPALLGGFAVSVLLEDGRVERVRASLGEGLEFFAMIPPFSLSTAKARAALPREVPFADAARNSGRAALVAAAFMGRDWDRLAAACSDRLHEPYRAPLIPGFGRALAAARGAGALAAWLSGAGPTVMALGRTGDEGLASSLGECCRGARPEAWRLLRLAPDDRGATVEEVLA